MVPKFGLQDFCSYPFSYMYTYMQRTYNITISLCTVLPATLLNSISSLNNSCAFPCFRNPNQGLNGNRVEIHWPQFTVDQPQYLNLDISDNMQTNSDLGRRICRFWKEIFPKIRAKFTTESKCKYM